MKRALVISRRLWKFTFALCIALMSNFHVCFPFLVREETLYELQINHEKAQSKIGTYRFVLKTVECEILR